MTTVQRHHLHRTITVICMSNKKCLLGICDGSDYVIVKLAADQYRESYQECECVEHKERLRIFGQRMAPLKWAAIPDTFAPGGFDSFDQSLQPKAYDVAVKWSVDPVGWVFLCGPPGTGKTHLSAAANRVQLKRTRTAVLLSVPAMISALRPNEKTNSAAIMNQLKSIDCLGLDDLGAQRNTEWVTEQIFTLVDYRSMHNLSTFFTSNPNIDELATSPGWDRITDRIIEQSVMVKMQPGSYRRTIAKNRLNQNRMETHE